MDLFTPDPEAQAIDRQYKREATSLERRLVGMDDYLPPHTGARSRRQEARHFRTGEFRRAKLHMIGDVGKELPEDAELENLVDMDIPGLATPGERSFDSVSS